MKTTGLFIIGKSFIRNPVFPGYQPILKEIAIKYRTEDYVKWSVVRNKNWRKLKVNNKIPTKDRRFMPGSRVK